MPPADAGPPEDAGPVRVTTGARLHVGFLNLSLSRRRLYGGLGVAIDAPRLVVAAEPADGVRRLGDASSSADGRVEDASARTADAVLEYAERATDLLGVPGAAVALREPLPRHVGLGSGTQTALATLAAVAAANGRAVEGLDRTADDRTATADDRGIDIRALAPALGRGGRSGVGVAAFEAGGFVLDAGHPTDRYTTARPPDGEWTVPPVAARHDLPADWRFVVCVPDAPEGRSGAGERAAMRSVLEAADPAVADEVAAVVAGRLLPAAATGDLPAFGAAVTEVDRRNGAWYADLQGGVYRPPAGELVAALSDCPAVVGTGQSSWGPAVYAVTDADGAAAVRDAAEGALAAVGGGEVVVAPPRNGGARVERV